MYAVIENRHITGAEFVETVLFAGSLEECVEYEHNTRRGYKNRCEVDCYTVNVEEYKNLAKYLDALKAFAETLTKEQKEEIIEIDGKRYAKYILDFKKEYFKEKEV